MARRTPQPRGLLALLDMEEAAPPPPTLAVAPAVAASPQRRALPLPRRRITMIAGAAAALLWGTWATHSILGLQHGATHLVRVQLADLVREYVQAEARSGGSASDITAQTGVFLNAVNAAISGHARGGEIVLLSNAVVDGDVPDITTAVRQEVYAKIPRPQPVPAAAAQSSPAPPQLFSPMEPPHGDGK